MHLSTLTIENFRCFGSGAKRLELHFRRGLTALVGENDSGKTAVIDALRFVLGTTDQEWHRLEDTDFHKDGTSREIRIVCKFEGLSARDKRAFVEFLTYGLKDDEEQILYVNWTAKDTGELRGGRPYLRPEVHSGKDGQGPTLAPEVRVLLHATYLRPLRDAEQALSAGRGSRLAQVLQRTDSVRKKGNAYDRSKLLGDQKLSVLAIAQLIGNLLEKQEGIGETHDKIDDHLKRLSLSSDDNTSRIEVGGSTIPDVRLRQLLEKLDLVLDGDGKAGLGSNNLLFMACELLLLAQEEEGNKLLLIEEPEAHLHAQRQLRVMRYLQEQAENKGIQIIITTHSPNLASAIDLNNIVMIHNGHAFSMAEEETNLEPSDYSFLQRFLDVTKANLFFAKGVMIVEGDAENILLPTLAKLIDRDFTEHGVSIVNVGGVGLRRYARIFQRKDGEEEKDKHLGIPVACVTDMDVMPNCAPLIIGKVRDDKDWPEKNDRRWRAKVDFDDEYPLSAHREKKEEKASGQCVRTFVSDEWTLEYDLALGPKDDNGSFSGGLAEDVFVAACQAENDNAINEKKTTIDVVAEKVMKEFRDLKESKSDRDDCTAKEVLASRIYAKFASGGVSKAIAAQYLAEWLQCKQKKSKLSSYDLRSRLPKYLVKAIDYVTGIDVGNDIPGQEEGA